MQVPSEDRFLLPAITRDTCTLWTCCFWLPCSAGQQAERASAHCMEQQVKVTVNFLQRLADLHWPCALPRYTRSSCIPVAAFADPSSGKAQQGICILWYSLWLYAEPLLSEQLPNTALAWWGLTGTSPPGPTNCAHLPCCGFQHHFRSSRMWKRWSETNAKWAWSGCSPKCQLPN